MVEDLLSNHRLPSPEVVAPRPRRKLQLSTTISLVVLFALAVIAVSIGIAQAETLSAMVDDETGRLALFGLIFGVVATGGVTAFVMWMTAPTTAYEEARKQLPALAHIPAKWAPVRRQEHAPLNDL
jgi:hypothetical protein